MTFYQAHLGDKPPVLNADLSPESLKKGLVVRSVNWLGDAVMTLPAVYALRQLEPVERLCIVCPKKLEAFWRAFPWVDSVVSFSQRRMGREDKKKVRDFAAGVGVVFPNSTGSAMDLKGCGLQHLVGRRGRLRTFLLTHTLPAWKRIPGQDTHHQLREYLQLARFCGSDVWGDEFPPASPEVSADFPESLGVKSESPLLLLSPGAAFGPAKQWPQESYAETAKLWMEKGGQVLVAGAPGEEEVASEVCRLAPGALNCAGKTSLEELMHLLGLAAACVVNDSGSMHLAAAMGARGAAIFGSTDPVATGPLGDQWVIHDLKTDCSPCLQRQCPLTENQYHCLRDISPQDVFRSIEGFFE